MNATRIPTTVGEAEALYGTRRDGVVSDLTRDGWVVVRVHGGAEGWRDEGGELVYVDHWGAVLRRDR
jgi:hypothetical protein